MHCKKCDKPINGKIYPDNTCQSCYNYYHKGGTDNPIPAKGVIAHDYRGYVVCHICGRAYKRLGSHIKECHKMTIADYKAEFELCNNARTTEQNYSKHMSKLAYEYAMDQQLKIVGVATRIKKGQKDMRKGKKVRLQECINKKMRMLEVRNNDKTTSV